MAISVTDRTFQPLDWDKKYIIRFSSYYGEGKVMCIMVIVDVYRLAATDREADFRSIKRSGLIAEALRTYRLK